MVPARPSDPRRELGARGEQLAAEHLDRCGYVLLARNWRCRAGELDIVASDADVLVFCEVKTRVSGRRGGPAGPLDGIGQAKRRRLRALARAWMATSASRPFTASVRFDAVGVTLDRDGALVCLEHVEDAF